MQGHGVFICKFYHKISKKTINSGYLPGRFPEMAGYMPVHYPEHPNNQENYNLL